MTTLYTPTAGYFNEEGCVFERRPGNDFAPLCVMKGDADKFEIGGGTGAHSCNRCTNIHKVFKGPDTP